MSITTIVKKIEPMFGEDFDIVLSYPTSANEKKRSPISCFVSSNGSSEPFGAYIYSIINPRTSEVFQTVLNNSDEQSLDLTKRLSMLITKKYGVPSYVSFSGSFQMDQHIVYIKEVIKLIDEKLSLLNK